MQTIDMKKSYLVNGLTYLPRQDGNSNGNIGQHTISVSVDGVNWGSPVATGTYVNDATLKQSNFANITARYIRLAAQTEAQGAGNPWTSAAEINVLSGLFVGKYKITVDSQETAVANNPGTNAVDGDTSTFWHTAYSTSPIPGFPHRATLDLGSILGVHSLTYTPRQDGSPNGNIGSHSIDVSTDNITFTHVASGTFLDDQSSKLVEFGETPARYVRLTALSEAGNRGTWTSAAEISVNYTSSAVPPTSLGQWGATIDFPIVPVAAAVLHDTGKILTWSSYAANSFTGGPGGFTLTATYDPATGTVSQRTVSNTHHDMFCPGLSIDNTGRPIVTGGNDAPRISIYDSVADSWISGTNMQIARGYQATATLSDGRIFIIGGSWSGGQGGKNGETFNPATNVSTLLPGALVAPMLTADAQGVYRQDNHGWLFGWKNSSVFQAGPSTAMNWYGTIGSGSQQAAGPRASDGDSMNGNAVMYDAVNGKILTIGGAPNYQDNYATANAHIITIGNPGSTATVTTLAPMTYARSFANAVVLPDGKVFITGGQAYAVPFTDTTSVQYPELWDPATSKFTVMNPMAIPRTYHSIALLMPDATVINGGGGLCGTCTTNHFDAEVFSPPYLFNADGSRATRPVITSVSAKTVVVGGSITATTNSAVTSFSLIRYGSSTHTVDTDQRRIALTPITSGMSYTFKVPSDAGIALPGYWMLFAINSAGVPSVASTILIKGS